MSFVVMVALTLPWLTGCNSQPTATAPYDSRAVSTMSVLYSDYLRQNKNRPPADEQTYRSFLASKQEMLDGAGLTVDEVFISPRNGEPLAWVFGRPAPTDRTSGMTYVGYETKSTDGKRLVIATRGMYRELDDAAFRQAFPDAP